MINHYHSQLDLMSFPPLESLATNADTTITNIDGIESFSLSTTAAILDPSNEGVPSSNTMGDNSLSPKSNGINADGHYSPVVLTQHSDQERSPQNPLMNMMPVEPIAPLQLQQMNANSHLVAPLHKFPPHLGHIPFMPRPNVPPFGQHLVHPMSNLMVPSNASLVVPPQNIPLEPPRFGPGYPYPLGGWAYGKSVGNPYYYLKDDDYLGKKRIIDRRVAMQLAYIYLIDKCPYVGDFVDSLHSDQIVLVSHVHDDRDNVVKLILKSNVIPHVEYTFNDLAQITLTPGKHIVLLADASEDVESSEYAIAQIQEFARLGGMIFSFNHSVVLLDQIFKNKVSYRHGSSTVDKPIKVKLDLQDQEDIDVFECYVEELKGYNELVLRQGIQRVKQKDPQVKVLLEEAGPCPNQSLAIKFKHGSGTVYHLLTSHLASKVGTQGGTTFQGLSEMLDLPSRELAVQTIQELQTRTPLPLRTISAWQASLSCGYYPSINTARSLVVTVECFFALLRKHLKPHTFESGFPS